MASCGMVRLLAATCSTFTFSCVSRGHMKQLRLLAFGCLGIASFVLATASRQAIGDGVAAGWETLLLNVVAGVFCVAVLVDTFWHAIKGQGQACRHCGHLRQMSLFRVYSKCPNCGQ